MEFCNLKIVLHWEGLNLRNVDHMESNCWELSWTSEKETKCFTTEEKGENVFHLKSSHRVGQPTLKTCCIAIFGYL